MRHLFRALNQLACIVLATSVVLAQGQTTMEWQATCAELARQIAGLTGPGVVSLSVRNLSAIPAEQIPGIQQALIKDLAGLGVTVRAGAETASTIRVTLSQTSRQGLWVAEVQQGPELKVAMVAAPEVTAAGKSHTASLLLRSTLLVSQAEPILDAEWVSRADGLLAVLSPDEVTLYREGATPLAAVTKMAAMPVRHERAFPRDARGVVEVTDDGSVRAYLPGVICRTSARMDNGVIASQEAACADSDDPWPMGSRKAFFNASRNFFTGVMVPADGSEPQAFFSAAELANRAGTIRVESMAGGGVRVFEGASARNLGGTRDWGSELAALRSGCGSGTQLLTSAAGDQSGDSVQAYEIDRVEAVPASIPMPFEGEVTAMWPMKAQDAVLVVVHSFSTHHYEAYSVSATCSL